MIGLVFLSRKNYGGCFQFTFMVILGSYLIVSEKCKGCLMLSVKQFMWPCHRDVQAAVIST